jgi:hypothetical protein
MDLSALHEHITRDALADVAACRRELEHIRRARGLLDAREVHLLGRLDGLTAEQPSVFPEGEVADAAKAGLGLGTKVRDRKKVCDLVPELGEALAAGSTTGDRVDTVAKATSGLTAAEREAVAEQGTGSGAGLVGITFAGLCPGEGWMSRQWAYHSASSDRLGEEIEVINVRSDAPLSAMVGGFGARGVAEPVGLADHVVTRTKTNAAQWTKFGLPNCLQGTARNSF